MGVFDFLTGNADPDPSLSQLPAAELRQRLLALRDPVGRWQVRETNDDGAAELVAEWTMTAEEVIEWVRIAGQRETKRVLLRLAEDDHVVRSVDHDGTLAWDAGSGGLHFQATAFRGQSRHIGKSWDIGGGTVETQSFDTDAIKQPLRDTVAAAGWGWHGVAFASL